MNRVCVIIVASFLLMAGATYAANLPATPVSQILKHESVLGLSDSQLKKLEIVEKTTQQKIMEAKVQADIRLSEIEKFTSNWREMNSTAVRGLIKEYYDCLANCKIAELNGISQAKGILTTDQYDKYQHLISAEAMKLDMDYHTSPQQF